MASQVFGDHRRVTVTLITAIERGPAQHLRDEVCDGSKVLRRHLRKYGCENRIRGNAVIESLEELLERLDPTYPLEQGRNVDRCHRHEPPVVRSVRGRRVAFLSN